MFVWLNGQSGLEINLQTRPGEGRKGNTRVVVTTILPGKFGKLLEIQFVILYHLHVMNIVVSLFGPSVCLYDLILWLHLAASHILLV